MCSHRAPRATTSLECIAMPRQSQASDTSNAPSIALVVRRQATRAAVGCVRLHARRGAAACTGAARGGKLQGQRTRGRCRHERAAANATATGSGSGGRVAASPQHSGSNSSASTPSCKLLSPPCSSRRAVCGGLWGVGPFCSVCSASAHRAPRSAACVPQRRHAAFQPRGGARNMLTAAAIAACRRHRLSLCKRMHRLLTQPRSAPPAAAAGT
jgi:hypothetical protein